MCPKDLTFSYKLLEMFQKKKKNVENMGILCNLY